MNNIKKYPVTYTLLALCILTYIGTTLLFSIDMNAILITTLLFSVRA